MMSLVQQVFVMIEFTHVAGYLSWKDGVSIIMIVQTLYDPSDYLLNSQNLGKFSIIEALYFLDLEFFFIYLDLENFMHYRT